MLKAIFFDRDGTLIDEPETETINSWDKFKLKEGLSDLARLRDAGYAFFIISNQEAIGEGGLSQEFYDDTNNKLLTTLAEYGIVMEKIYTCPHARTANCECRKPERGLVDQAFREYDIDVASSYMVGDRPSDVELGKLVGLKTIHIESPWHKLPPSFKPNFVAKGLPETVDCVLGRI